jgi:hypothetical protein
MVSSSCCWREGVCSRLGANLQIISELPKEIGKKIRVMRNFKRPPLRKALVWPVLKLLKTGSFCEKG